VLGSAVVRLAATAAGATSHEGLPHIARHIIQRIVHPTHVTGIRRKPIKSVERNDYHRMISKCKLRGEETLLSPAQLAGFGISLPARSAHA